jgi:hypothetical protein
MPHAEVEFEAVTHWLFWQHPLAHEDASQTHWLLEQR